MNPRVGHLPYSWILHQFGSFSVPTPRNLASKIEKCANARAFIQGGEGWAQLELTDMYKSFKTSLAQS